MAKVMSEYDVESKFIDRLESIGYGYVDIKDYSGVVANLRTQLAAFNAAKLIDAKGAAEFSDTEFNRVMIHLDNHTVYESAKLLRDKYILTLDNGKTVYLDFFSFDTDRNIYQVTHQVTMDPAHKDDVVYKNRYDVTILIMLHVGAANIEKSTGILLPCMTASEEGITSGKYLFDETCVVYSKIRPELSKATIPGFTGLCSADAYPLKPRADILPRIILMQILSDKFVKFATSTSARTKMPKINQEELGEYVFAIPCFEEQCLIAGFLSDFDEAIAAAKKELELWKELKKGLLQQMFV